MKTAIDMVKAVERDAFGMSTMFVVIIRATESIYKMSFAKERPGQTEVLLTGR
ncbi:MAG: hypothetical protein WA936_01520 [Erythrobacter sp.]|uniref:hypothetical protein n=1 Tax=Erythrobacter sp. TaxID=1042 RepID=UPI003C71A805